MEAAIRALPDKSCALDPLPTTQLKAVANVVVPFLAELFNRSLSNGSVPDVLKEAYITPRLKKSDLDPSDTLSYCQISNLPVMSKLLERIVAKMLLNHLDRSQLLPRLQSAYRSKRSTETALVKVLSGILLAIDSGDLAALVLSDLSAAFDTVDHAVLLRRLETFGIRGTIHWFESYLIGRQQHIRTPSTFSPPTVIRCGVPQGSVLGLILFLLYVAAVQLLIEDCGLHLHHFADDTQKYGFCSPTPSSCTKLQSRISECIDVASSWMRSHWLNTAKMGIIWLTLVDVRIRCHNNLFESAVT